MCRSNKCSKTIIPIHESFMFHHFHQLALALYISKENKLLTLTCHMYLIKFKTHTRLNGRYKNKFDDVKLLFLFLTLRDIEVPHHITRALSIYQSTSAL